MTIRKGNLELLGLTIMLFHFGSQTQSVIKLFVTVFIFVGLSAGLCY